MVAPIAAHAYSSTRVLDIAMYFICFAGAAALWFGIAIQRRDNR